MRYCIDIDGTICSNTDGAYMSAAPFTDIIAAVNRLYDSGCTVYLQTARGATTGIDWRADTERQLAGWGVKYHALFFGKPTADVYIDDKARTADDWHAEIRRAAAMPEARPLPAPIQPGRTIAIIPARAGSKGVPGKNIRPLGGHPLIAWAVAAARLCPAIQRVIVSTDSPRIADIARAAGAEVPFLRPAEWATDTATDLEVMTHALQWLGSREGGVPELVVHLRPTTPLREPAAVAEAVRALAGAPAATALRSVHALPEPPQKMFAIHGGYLGGLFPHDPRPEYYNLPRQDFPAAYQPNGVVDVLRSETVFSGAGLHGGRMLAFPTAPAVEVDTPEDIERLEFQLARHGHPLLETLNAMMEATP